MGKSFNLFLTSIIFLEALGKQVARSGQEHFENYPRRNMMQLFQQMVTFVFFVLCLFAAAILHLQVIGIVTGDYSDKNNGIPHRLLENQYNRNRLGTYIPLRHLPLRVVSAVRRHFETLLFNVSKGNPFFQPFHRRRVLPCVELSIEDFLVQQRGLIGHPILIQPLNRTRFPSLVFASRSFETTILNDRENSQAQFYRFANRRVFQEIPHLINGLIDLVFSSFLFGLFLS